MEAATMSNVKRTIILVIAILLGAILNLNTADAMPAREPSFTSVTKMYSKACKNLKKKQQKSRNMKVKNTRFRWR